MNTKTINNTPPKSGFTLIELLVVIVIIGILSSIGISSFASSIQRTRDAKRIAEVKEIVNSLKRYYLDYGAYPEETTPSGNLSGWEVSLYGPFLERLDPYFETKTPVDPIHTVAAVWDPFGPRPTDGSLFYAYYNYPSGTNYGCDFSGPFSIIAFKAFEIDDPSELPKAFCDNRANPSPSTCPRGGILNSCRYWNTEYDYSVMLKK